MSGCEFCVDAGMDFDYCRVCGRGERVERQATEPMTGLRLAVRLAYGGPLNGDGQSEREAFYAALERH